MLIKLCALTDLGLVVTEPHTGFYNASADPFGVRLYIPLTIHSPHQTDSQSRLVRVQAVNRYKTAINYTKPGNNVDFKLSWQY